MTKTFILCDPNIVQVGGHYLELAIRVLHAAEKSGYRPVLLTNQAFSANVPDGWEVVRAFTAGFWGRPFPPADLHVEFTKEDRAFLRLQYSRYGLAWNATDHMKDVQHYNREYPPSSRFLKLVQDIADVKSLASAAFAQTRLDATRPLEFQDKNDRAALYEARRKSIKEALSALHGKSPLERSILATAAGKMEQQNVSALHDLISTAHQSDLFCEQLNAALQAVECNEDTVILYPTINFFQLRGIKDSILSNETSRRISHHIIMRRNLYSGYAGTFNNQEWGVHYARTALALMNDVPDDVNCNFYTDTKPLTYQYGILNTAEFRTGPIPIEPSSENRMLRASLPEETALKAVLVMVPFKTPELARAIASQFEALVEAHLDPALFALKFVMFSGEFSPFQMKTDFRSLNLRCDVDFIMSEEVDVLDAASFDILAFQGFPPAFEQLALRAFENACPVIVPEAAWLGAAMRRQAHAYHDAALKPHTPFAQSRINDLAWAKYDFHAHTTLTIAAGDRREVTVQNNVATVFELPVPEGASLVRLRIRLVDAGRAAALRLNGIAFFRSRLDAQKALGRHDFCIEGRDHSYASFVLPVPDEGAILSVSLCNFTSTKSFTVSDCDVEWYADVSGVALQPGGLTFPDLVGDFQNSWITPILNAAANRQAYIRSCIPWMDPVKLRALVPVAERHMVISYLGDAREEKGFHHLPVVARMLENDHEYRPVTFRVQLYHSSNYPENRCLEAAALLNHLSRNRVSLIPQSLESAEYAREILCSDAMIVPYNRDNYIARSSGIFAEALAAGIPVVVPAGTWMSSVLDGLSYQQHTKRIVPAHILERPAYEWGFYSNHRAEVVAWVDQDARLQINGQNLTFINLAPPEDAGYIWIVARPEAAHFGTFVEFSFSFQDQNRGGKEISSVTRIVGGEDCETCSVLLALPKGCKFIWLGIRNAFTSEFLSLSAFNLRFVHRDAGGIAETAAGVTYVTGASMDDERKSLKDAVVRLLDQFPLYKQSAMDVQPDWVAQHNSERLIELIEEAHQSPRRFDRQRFRGRDW